VLRLLELNQQEANADSISEYRMRTVERVDVLQLGAGVVVGNGDAREKRKKDQEHGESP